jgi:hypothetical protein
MPPVHFSDDEMEVVLALAAPIDRRHRGEFLAAVAEELATCPQPGPGVVHRAARAIQRRYLNPPAPGLGKYARAWEPHRLIFPR